MLSCALVPVSVTPMDKQMDVRTDVAVVGLGAMGAATLYQLAQRGVAAIGIDRFAPPHTMGSTHGDTRITRRAVGEGDAYVPFVTRSHAIWRTLEAATGETLFNPCGLLVMAPRGVRTGQHGKADFLRTTITVAERHAIPHDVLDAPALAARFPCFTLHGDEEACHELGGGYVHPERCVAAQLQQAAAGGATILTGRTVMAIRRQGTAMAVETDAGTIRADQVVVAAGAWAGPLLGAAYAATLVPYRQTLHWFPVANPDAHRPGASPAYIWRHGAETDAHFYGFPALPGQTVVKAATEQYADRCDPDTMDRVVSAQESADMYAAHVEGRIRGAGPHATRAATCLYTITPDSGFVIGRHPKDDRIVVVSPCSGHGFKHSAGIGESVAQLVCDGRSAIDLAPFALEWRA